MNKVATCLLINAVLVAGGVSQEKVNLDVVAEIKAEGIKASQVMETMHQLTDKHGPRLTSSPNYKAAAEWCVESLNGWGLESAALEPWGAFGKGWQTNHYSVEMTAPQYANLIAHPKAWTPGTNGPVSGEPILVEIESEEDFAEYRGKLQGSIVLWEPTRDAETHFEADAKRHSEADLTELMKAPAPGEKPSWWARRAEYRKRRELRLKRNAFFKEEGVAVVLEPSQREHGTIRVSSGGSYKMDAEPVVPQLVVAIEHYWRIVRLLKHDIQVNLKVEVENQFFDDDSLGYNVVAEIPGADKRLKSEVVMLGGHLDSWHSGTGATDNAAGCAVALEAVRILKAIGAKPRRTIRIALWGGEEQGLLGSRGYVKKHFGDRENMNLTGEHPKLSGYFNLDNGSGKIRGIYLQENDAAKPIFSAFLEPFGDMGASTLTTRNTGGTDHLAFDALGLPGFQFVQDPLDYSTRTHHTNMDVYDHAIEADLIQASVIMASFVYHTAMREQKLPRKPLPKPRKPATF